jgi:trigger factor
MNVTIEKNSAVYGIINVNVVEADYADKVKKELRTIGAKRVIPGFRQGHAPMPTLVRMFGKQVKSEVLNDVVYDAVITHIRDNKLHVLGEPLPLEKKEINLSDKDYDFQYEVGFAPEIDITVDKSVKLPRYDIEVSEQMYKDEDEALRKRFAKQEPGEVTDDRSLIKGSLQQLNADGSVNENEGAIQVTNAIIAPFTFKDDKQKALFVDKHVNDKVVFNPYDSCNGNAAELSSMLNIEKNIAGDVHSDFVLAISEIIVMKDAEHDQPFYDSVFGKDKVQDEAAYEAAVKEGLAVQLARNSEEIFDVTARNYFVEKYGDMELPTEFLKKWLVVRNEELTAENIDKEYEHMLPSLKWQLIEERIANVLNIEIKEDDVMEYAKAVANRQFIQYGITNMDDATITEYAKRLLNDNNTRSRIVEATSEMKLFSTLRNNVTIEKKTVSFDEFKKIAEETKAL